MKKCDSCGSISVREARDKAGAVFRACREHAPYLDGWVRNSDYESDCDSLASRAYELAAYGDD
jgi:hypothetical protein